MIVVSLKKWMSVLAALVIVAHACMSQPAEADTFYLDRLAFDVEILVDTWGVPHIYAKNQSDMFFAQGFYAARDRLFQFELWRRQATGTVAELLGERELTRDIGTRLFRYRGDMSSELSHYHEDGIEITESFVAGVNAYIRLTEDNPALLPIEFDLLGTKPQYWTPDVVISRHQGLLGNIEDELEIGRVVASIGEERAKELYWFHPGDPDLTLAPGIDTVLLNNDVLALYRAYRRPVRFKPDDIVADAAASESEYRYWAGLLEEHLIEDRKSRLNSVGSNNWVVAGELTVSGSPIMANDPHRTLAVPSLRYMAHLVSPGWNVIGGGEPEIPGISIGHNQQGAWGLTVFRTDAEDLYVYRLNPENADQYWYNGAWVNFEIERDTIPVKGQDPEPVLYRYSVHGPVVFYDRDQLLACGMRCGWLEPGGSPYLASLRMDQAETFEEFREACSYSHIPGENMVWADRAGNIGWQAVGIAPVRNASSGLVPVPGDGSVEWDGYQPIMERPNVENPPSGYIITANENVTPEDYPHSNTIGFSWADPFRGERIKELLDSSDKHSVRDMCAYQTDYLALPARILVPLLSTYSFPDSLTEICRGRLVNWDFVLDPSSVEATIYVEWQEQLHQLVERSRVPLEVQDIAYLQLSRVLQLLFTDEAMVQPAPDAYRLAMQSFRNAVRRLRSKFGGDLSEWQYGQRDHKHVEIQHPLAPAVSKEFRELLNVGIAPRGGYGYTVGMTSGNLNQSSGATFRIIADTGNWDASVAMNSPGQSGDPMHRNYRNLFASWASDEFFPLSYTRVAVEENTAFRLLLKANN